MDYDDDETPMREYPEPTIRGVFESDLHTAICNHLLADDDLALDAKTWTTGAASRLFKAILPTIDQYMITREHAVTAASDSA